MSAWALAVWGLLPAFVAPVAVALRGTVASRLVAVQLASGVAVLVLEAMSFAFDQDSYASLALAAALLSTAGTLVVTTAVERWL